MWRCEKSDGGDGLDDSLIFDVILTLHVSLLRLIGKGFNGLDHSYLLHNEPTHTVNHEY